MPDPTARRGPYAKGVAKRQQILDEALKAYAESDSTGPSLKAIAARVGLSERGLLHYFSSRDELFISILTERDAVELALIGPNPLIGDLLKVEARSAKTPGLVRLFLEMAAAAPDSNNPAHAFFSTRYARLRSFMRDLLRQAPPIVEADRSEEDAAFLGRMLIAASDGLQMQWLLDSTIDLEGDLQRLARRLGIVPDPQSAPRGGLE